MAAVADESINKSLSKIRDDYIEQNVNDAGKRESTRRLLVAIENEFLIKAHIKKYRFESFLGALSESAFMISVNCSKGYFLEVLVKETVEEYVYTKVKVKCWLTFRKT